MKNLLRFLDYISRLKLTVRSGWNFHKVPGIRETIGSHSFGVAFFAWFLAKRENSDVDKTLKLALIHDLLEGITGDITPHDKSYMMKKAIEKKAIPKLKKLLPVELRNDVINLLEELNKGKTKEAKIVLQADKLDTAFQAYLYEKKKFKGNIQDSDFSAFFDFPVEEKFSREFLNHIRKLRKN